MMSLSVKRILIVDQQPLCCASMLTKYLKLQAKIKLKKDGVFYLHNLGRRGLTVNNKSIEKGERAILGSNCFIEVRTVNILICCCSHPPTTTYLESVEINCLDNVFFPICRAGNLRCIDLEIGHSDLSTWIDPSCDGLNPTIYKAFERDT
jgi:hypothetical protein